jgi:gluconokinase
VRRSVVVMGVSGCGKSSVGAALAARLGLAFRDADALHAPEAVAKMARGVPLDDADRGPWLDRVGAVLADGAAHPAGVVVACSALKRAYRDRLRRAAPGVRFVFLDGDAATLAQRLRARTDHYMPPALLASQLATLEPPGPDEGDAVRVAVDAPLARVVEHAAQAAERPAAG